MLYSFDRGVLFLVFADIERVFEFLAVLSLHQSCVHRAEGQVHVVFRIEVQVVQVFEILVFQSVFRSDSLLGIIDQKLANEVHTLLGGVGNQFFQFRALPEREVELHVRCVFLESLQDLLIWRPQDVVNLMDLVELVGAWEQREEADNLKHDAADSPQVHFEVVVAVGHQALRSSVPAGGDVLSVRVLGVKRLAAP